MVKTPPSFLIPDFPLPDCLAALITTRKGGFSLPPYASFNLALHVGDTPRTVEQNRVRLSEQVAAFMGEAPHFFWLNQVHGTRVRSVGANFSSSLEADAAVTRERQIACTLLTADCVPVLFCEEKGEVIACAHAGWRGLLNGILEKTVAAMQVPPQRILAYLGPAISQTAFEVGEEIKLAFVQKDPLAQLYFVPSHHPNKCFCDLYGLARLRLNQAGVFQVFGGDFCTFSEKDRFYSFRREGKTGRMVSAIWRL